ncbi:hypothetical protein CHU98_g5839 [Xylaria longipes]|nr:hypothetical protein CHU98_g5839 [Xylaria longipes]
MKHLVTGDKELAAGRSGKRPGKFWCLLSELGTAPAYPQVRDSGVYRADLGFEPHHSADKDGPEWAGAYKLLISKKTRNYFTCYNIYETI